MESYSILKDLAIIIIAAKLFGILARKCKAPQVVGEIIAGLLIGPFNNTIQKKRLIVNIYI